MTVDGAGARICEGPGVAVRMARFDTRDLRPHPRPHLRPRSSETPRWAPPRLPSTPWDASAWAGSGCHGLSSTRAGQAGPLDHGLRTTHGTQRSVGFAEESRSFRGRFRQDGPELEPSGRTRGAGPRGASPSGMAPGVGPRMSCARPLRIVLAFLSPGRLATRLPAQTGDAGRKPVSFMREVRPILARS